MENNVRMPNIQNPILRQKFYQAELDLDNYNKAVGYIDNITAEINHIKKEINHLGIFKALENYLDDYENYYDDGKKKRLTFYKYLKRKFFLSTATEMTCYIYSFNREKKTELKSLRDKLKSKNSELTRSKNVRIKIANRIKESWEELTIKNNIYFMSREEYLHIVDFLASYSYASGAINP